MVLSSAKDELAAFRPIVDDKHLARREFHSAATFVIEALGARGVPHPHRDVVFSGRQYKALIDARRTIACYAGRPQARSIDVGAITIELDVDRPARARTILYPAHVRRLLGDFLRSEPSAFPLAIRAMYESQHHNAGTIGDLPIGRVIG